MKKYTIKEIREQRIAIWCTKVEEAEKIAIANGYTKGCTIEGNKNGFEILLSSDPKLTCPSWQGGYSKKYFILEDRASICIDFEQIDFNENNMKEKEIISYKLVKPEYEEVAAKICGYTNGKLNPLTTIEGHFLSYSLDYTNIKKAGVLDLWFKPIYKEESKFIEGEWLFREERRKHIARFLKIEDQILVSKEIYYEDGKDYAKESKWGSIKTWRKATQEEIFNILSKVAKQKGFKEGVKVDQRSAYLGAGLRAALIKNNSFIYENNNLSIGEVGIYNGGDWATIVKNSFPTINGHEGKKEDNLVIYGCAKFHIDDLRTVENFGIPATVVNRKIKSITLDSGVTLTIEQIKEIIKAYEEN